MAAGEVEFLLEAMYRYLYDLYPPRFPEILDEVDRGTSTERVYLGMRLVYFAITADSSIAGLPISALTVSRDVLIVAVRRGLAGAPRAFLAVDDSQGRRRFRPIELSRPRTRPKPRRAARRPTNSLLRQPVRSR